VIKSLFSNARALLNRECPPCEAFSPLLFVIVRLVIIFSPEIFDYLNLFTTLNIFLQGTAAFFDLWLPNMQACLINLSSRYKLVVIVSPLYYIPDCAAVCIFCLDNQRQTTKKVGTPGSIIGIVRIEEIRANGMVGKNGSGNRLHRKQSER